MVFNGILLMVYILFLVYYFYQTKEKIKLHSKSNYLFEWMTIGLLILILFTFIYLFQNQYFNKLDSFKTTTNIKLCSNSCVDVTLSQQDAKLMHDELERFYFEKKKDFIFVTNDQNTDSYESRFFTFYIDDQVLYYNYVRIKNQESIYLIYQKHNVYYTKSGRNDVTILLDQLYEQYKSELHN